MATERRESDRRLASQKQQTISGGDVSYYLTELWDGVVVENDDVNEVLELTFAQGTSFKSVTRLCKLRMDLGKPGSTAKYEIDKIVYYNKRTHATSQRHEWGLSVVGRTFRFLRDIFHRRYFDNVLDTVIEVERPKRLEPYSFRVGDYIDALRPNLEERMILENIFQVALMRLVVGPLRVDEVEAAQMGVIRAQVLEADHTFGNYR